MNNYSVIRHNLCIVNHLAECGTASKMFECMVLKMCFLDVLVTRGRIIVKEFFLFFIILSGTSFLAEGWADLLPLSGAEMVKRRAVSEEVLVGTEVPQ